MLFEAVVPKPSDSGLHMRNVLQLPGLDRLSRV